MNEEKRTGGTSGDAARGKEAPDARRGTTNAASRARNQTVMLTPEMTGQVRAMLYQEPEEDAGTAPAVGGRGRDPLTELLPPMDWNRPEGSAAPAAEATSRSSEEFSRDLATTEDARSDRNASTGKLDSEIISEAVSAPAPRKPIQAAPQVQQPQFSVNPHAARHTASTGGMRRPDPRGRGAAVAAPTSKVVGFFVSFDKNQFGDVYEVRAGRWLITSRPTDHGEFILIEDESISPLHAIVRATKDGKIQVLDQLSEFGTGVTHKGAKEEQEVSGTMVNVEHGDILRLGERKFVVVAIPVIKALEPKTDEKDND